MIESLISRCRRPIHLAGWTLTLAAMAALTGCASLFEESRSEVVFDFQFENGEQEWAGAFADYSASMEEENLDLIYEHRQMPAATDVDRMGLFLGGNNLSDDLFMFVKRRLGDLQPSTTYEVRYTIQLASDAPTGCAGVGGAPGESVYLKGGASAEEPVAVLEDGDYRMNIDKGNQSQPGSSAVVIGSIENGSRECQNTPYQMITLHSQNQPVTARTDEDGILWLFVGTDSGFEGRTELYFDSIQIRLRLV